METQQENSYIHCTGCHCASYTVLNWFLTCLGKRELSPSPLFKGKSVQNLHCLREASLETFKVVSIPLNTTLFFPLRVPKLSLEDYASNLAQRRESSSFFVFKMTGTVQGTVCCFHLCQLPLKCAQLPQPAAMGAVGRPFAEQ